VNVTLKVGSATTQVTVADVTPMVDMTSPTVSERLDRQRNEQFPVSEAMGLVSATTPGFEGGNSSPRAFGLRNDSAELTVDGAPTSDRSEGGGQGAAAEATYIQEVQVNTLDSSAKFNRPATVVVVTKSGTNAPHGQLYESMKNNSVMGVARQRQNTFTTPPFLINNLFGGAVGGPVYIPKVYNGKNRTFFFFDYSKYMLRQRTSISTTVPTAAERSGDFSKLTDGALRPITIYDPYSTGAAPNYSRLPYLNNQIPASMMSPLAKYLYSITPLPTDPSVNPSAGNNWIAGAKTYQDRDAQILRVDHTFSDADHIFVRLQRASRVIAGNSGNGAPLLNDTTNLKYNMYPDRNGVISWNHSFSPTFFSESLLSDSWQYYQYYTGTSANEDVDAMLGQPNPFNGRTTIAFEMPRSAPATLVVYDAAGRSVRTLVRGEIGAGTHQAVWDGKDESGRAVANGVYLYRLTSMGETLRGQMILVR
jgi:hypothetical protein